MRGRELFAPFFRMIGCFDDSGEVRSNRIAPFYL